MIVMTKATFEVDLEYPETLHDLHNDYPLAVEKFKVSTNMLSNHAKNILETIDSKHDETSAKLCSTFFNKEKYVVNYRNLKFYLEQGTLLDEIHCVISFNQSPSREQKPNMIMRRTFFN